jgi:hypothetical protein
VARRYDVPRGRRVREHADDARASPGGLSERAIRHPLGCLVGEHPLKGLGGGPGPLPRTVVATEWFFPSGDYDESLRAVAVCGACPVRAERLGKALRNGENFAVWGGTTAQERPGFCGERRARRWLSSLDLLATRSRSRGGCRTSFVVTAVDRASAVLLRLGVAGVAVDPGPAAGPPDAQGGGHLLAAGGVTGGLRLATPPGRPGSRMWAHTVAALLAVANDVSEPLRLIPDGIFYWDLPESEVRRPGPEGSTSWHVHRAWSLLMGAPFVNIAVCHKTLHHKRPDVFPLLDRRTVKQLPKGSAWPAIHRDLNEAPAEFADLERRFATLAAANGGVALTRLRIHDVLLWCDASSVTDAARKAGRRWLEAHPSD